ncbi:MAG: cbb3-type cytochrome c oxidase subunit I [Desulfurococcales archaeon]|nr:cbb3-type cytochrome c oxidase subunit I [Desulfurococcales archaeon]
MSGSQINLEVENKFTKATIAIAIIAIVLGGVFGIIQVLTRTPNFPKLVGYDTYYLALTGHGVLMAIVFTTFYIMGISTYIVSRELKVNFSPRALWAAFALTLLGTVLAAIPILTGKANVLYTFYPPMKAHPLFYIGAAILVVGSWVYTFEVFRVFLKWRKQNPDVKIPVATFGILTTFIIWIIATPPVAVEVLLLLVPMSLFDVSVDVLLARTLFWWFGHPLVYFWLAPAIALWYYLVPKTLGVRLFSETMAKIAFILFIIASTPVGLHHQFVDPGVSPVLKFIHTLFTFTVATPSMLTAFNILATLERGGRVRGGKGLIGWIFKLPWSHLAFAGVIVPFLLFGNGGISGLVNASFQLNTVVHNTVWIVGHFHTTVGGAAALTFLAVTLLLIRELLGKELIAPKLALAGIYLWGIGQYIFSIGYYVAGVEGAPRRTAELTYGGMAPPSWIPWLQLGAIGAMVFWIGGVIIVAIIALSVLAGRPATLKPEEKLLTFNYTPVKNGNGGAVLDNMKLWVIVAIVLVIVGYMPPLIEIFGRGLSPAPPVLP